MTLITFNNIKADLADNYIKVFINENFEIDYIDWGISPKLASGTIAMYSEDAYVLYNNMDVSPK